MAAATGQTIEAIERVLDPLEPRGLIGCVDRERRVVSVMLVPCNTRCPNMGDVAMLQVAVVAAADDVARRRAADLHERCRGARASAVRA